MRNTQKFLRIFRQGRSARNRQSDIPPRALSNFLEHWVQRIMYSPTPLREFGFQMVRTPKNSSQYDILLRDFGIDAFFDFFPYRGNTTIISLHGEETGQGMGGVRDEDGGFEFLDIAFTVSDHVCYEFSWIAVPDCPTPMNYT